MHKEFKSLPKKYASLDFEGIEFPVSKKGYHETEMKSSVSVNVLDTKISNYMQFTDQTRVLKIIWDYCC